MLGTGIVAGNRRRDHVTAVLAGDEGRAIGFAALGFLARDLAAPSNAALVERAVELCAKYDRPVATWQQARQILGLRDAA
ncbi:3-keto-5-aminohexanoate cleavage protein [Paracoccus sp. M683]|uniref:3-keto-5-aminohexanoate cleavage protein n=1 Tax=Paracoccus sp. M683 TaxID=2594268 RepID=UPI00351AB04B